MKTCMIIVSLLCLSGLASDVYGAPEEQPEGSLGAGELAGETHPYEVGGAGGPQDIPFYTGPGAPRPGGGPMRQDGNIRELVEAVMAARLSKELGLNDEQTVLLVRRLAEFKEKTEQLRKHRHETLAELKSAIRAGESEEKTAEILGTLVACDRELAESRIGALEKVGADLTTTQRAKLYVAMGEFEGHMRRMVEKARERVAGRQMTPRFGPESPRPGGQRGFGEFRGMRRQGQPLEMPPHLRERLGRPPEKPGEPQPAPGE